MNYVFVVSSIEVIYHKWKNSYHVLSKTQHVPSYLDKLEKKQH